VAANVGQVEQPIKEKKTARKRRKVAPKQLKVVLLLCINTQIEAGKRMGITKGNSQ
jgi:hypothetical protein